VQKIPLDSLFIFLLFILFCAGIVLSNFFPGSFVFFAVCLFLAISGAYIFYRKGRIFFSDISIFLIFLFAGACWYSSFYPGSFEAFGRGRHSVSLQTTSLPVSKGNYNILEGRLRRIDNFSWPCRVKIIDYSQSLHYRHSYQLKGSMGAGRYSRRRKLTLWVRSQARIEELPSTYINRGLRAATLFFLDFFKKHCQADAWRFLGAVVLGRRELIGNEKELFARAGASHLLAISGLHVGLISAMLFFLLRFFHIGFRPSLFISLFFLCGYSLLTGINPATLRAVSMYAVFVCSFFARRKPNLLNALALAGFIALLSDPSLLFAVGFQLSFGAVLAIIAGYRISSLSACPNRVARYLKYTFFCSLFVTLALDPLTSYYFGKIYLGSIVYNLILIPFFTLIMIFAFLLIIFSPFFFIAQSLGAVISLLVHYFLKIVNWCGLLPFSYIDYRFSFWQVVGYYSFGIAATIAVAFYKQYQRGVRQRLF